MKVIFVCTGNTCRSPMLEFAFKHYLALNGITDIEVDSAGILNREKTASREAVAVLEAHSVPCTRKVSKLCSEKELASADFVITVAEEQAILLKKQLQKTYAFAGDEIGKIISVRDIIGYDIPDPFGQGREAYEKTYLLINKALPKILNYIKNRR